ncbi:tubulin-specific chaperone-like protein B [Cryomyces antarcticus]
MQAAHDIPLLITSENSSSERRITPSWSIAHLKTKLEPITGIPASSQKLTLKIASQPVTAIEAANEENVQLSRYPLQAYAEIHVLDTRPAGARVNFTDVSSVPKYEMPPDEYESRNDSVLAWKKSQKLGRFAPDAPSIEEQKIRALQREVDERGIEPGKRCHLLPGTDDRRGTVRFVGAIPQIPGLGPWVGIALDEPSGKNDGSVKGERYFECAPNCGVFVRPERVEVGDFPALDDLGEEMEEI